MDAPRWVDGVTIIFLDKTLIERLRETMAQAEIDASSVVAIATDLLRAIDGNAARCIVEAERALRDVARWTREVEMWREAERRGPQ